MLIWSFEAGGGFCSTFALLTGTCLHDSLQTMKITRMNIEYRKETLVLNLQMGLSLLGCKAIASQ
jgi:hypothetical protein